MRAALIFLNIALMAGVLVVLFADRFGRPAKLTCTCRHAKSQHSSTGADLYMFVAFALLALNNILPPGRSRADLVFGVISAIVAAISLHAYTRHVRTKTARTEARR